MNFIFEGEREPQEGFFCSWCWPLEAETDGGNAGNATAGPVVKVWVIISQASRDRSAGKSWNVGLPASSASGMCACCRPREFLA